MRIIKTLLVSAFTIFVIVLLNRPLGILPPLGKVLDPINGALANSENDEKDFNRNLTLEGLKSKVIISWEERRVPHIQANNNHDLYFAQGFVTAYFRLWQMDLQTRAAAGRVSEVAGKKALAFDRAQRRKGMVYAAENSLRAMEADPRTKEMLDAYRDGINAFIKSCTYRKLPVEYKLMNFGPEEWTNLRSALLLKYMADDLTGKTDDIAFTKLREQLGQEQFDQLFPERVPGSIPVIPEGTKWETRSLEIPKIPKEDSFNKSAMTTTNVGPNGQTITLSKAQQGIENQFISPDEDASKGSNNWAVSGKHTASGAAILCNDPHLGLNLPSLWFELQLTAPGINVYGVSLPGAPGIVIGFNDSLSWGVTNNYRDVKDYYEIEPLDENHYKFNGDPKKFSNRVEVIKSKDSADFIDTIRYTIHGPIQYEPRYPDPLQTGKTLAMTWMAHRGTNELLSLYLLNRATNYNEFVNAIQHFECPAQSFVYADRKNNIAMWGQGRFINKYKEQGKYIMPGTDSGTLWGETIPMNENPHALNPEQGFLASANQIVTDSTYPYWYNGNFVEFRAWAVNYILGMRLSIDSGIVNFLNLTHASAPVEPMIQVCQGIGYNPAGKIAISDMKNIQTSNYNMINYVVSKDFMTFLNHPVVGKLLVKFPKDGMGSEESLNPFDTTGTKIKIWWANLYKDIWEDDFPNRTWPSKEFTLNKLVTDSTYSYYDDIRTSKVESLQDIIEKSYQETLDSLDVLRKTVGLEWYKVKNTSLTHLAKIKAFSYSTLPIGGWSTTINATTSNHGPSWRMVVEMGKDSIEAWGVYPGGQSGNPGSKYYSNMIDYWVKGEYFKIKFITKDQNYKYDMIAQWVLHPPKN